MTDANIIPVFHILYDNTHCQSVSVASEATVANNVCFTLSVISYHILIHSAVANLKYTFKIASATAV